MTTFFSTKRWVAAIAIAATGVAGVITPAEAGVEHGGIVSENPANFTPNINDGAVYAIAQIGNTMYVGGDFTSVTRSGGGGSVTRRGLVAFNASTGAISSFAPSFNGAVWTLETDGNSLFVGGTFTTAAGVSRRYLAKFNTSTGSIDTGFNAGLNREVTDSALVDGRLIIGGEFTGSLRALDPDTGADTGFIDLSFSSTLGNRAGRLGIYRFAVDPAGTRLVAVGNFTSVGGEPHVRAVMINLDGARATVNPWYYAGLEKSCQLFFVPNYMRGVDFSPDGDYFVLIATGRNPATPSDLGISICDAAARFETDVPSPARPTWINYTGGDTVLSVDITDAAVYIQGHFRWVDNAGGTDGGFGGQVAVPAPTAVTRDGIAALDTTTGRAIRSWDPGKTRGVGGKVLLSTADGLWVGSDTTRIGGETRARIALLPATGTPPPPPPTNQPPNASFTQSCTALSCSFTSTSSDADGSIASTSWSIDGTPASGTTATHTFSSAGTYPVTVTVTDDDGATSSASGTVTVSDAPAGDVSFRNGAGNSGNSTNMSVTIPGNVQAGDTLLLFASVRNVSATVGSPTGVTGWSEPTDEADNAIRTVFWSKIADAGDAGSTVRIPVSARSKYAVQVLAYTGSTAPERIAQIEADVESGRSATHTAPSVTVGTDGSMIVHYWADKSSATTQWSVEAGATERVDEVGGGGGRIGSVSADRTAGVGPSGELDATSNASTGNATMWTIVLAP